MGITIEGWVEVSFDETNKSDKEKHWHGLISLLPIMNSCDEGSANLFGIAKYEVNSIDAIAMGRGLPENPGEQIKNDIKGIKEFEKMEGVEERFGFSYLYYNELKYSRHSILVENIESTQWGIVIKLIDTLISQKKFEPGQVRIVVWACI